MMAGGGVGVLGVASSGMYSGLPVHLQGSLRAV